MRRRLLVLAVVFPVLYIASIIASVVQDYRGTLRRAETDATSISTALREHADRAIGEADRLILSAAADIQGDISEGRAADENGLHRVLRAYSNSSPHFLFINAVDAKGDVIASGLTLPVPRSNVRDRDYFAFHAGNKDGMYISRPVLGRTSGQWVFTISRSLRNPDGSLRMILAAGISVAYFEHFYRSLNLGNNGRLLLVRHDGWVLVESPLVGAAVDKNVSGTPLFRQFGKTAHGTYHVDAGAVDGTPRIVGYTNSMHHPFIAVSSLSRTDVLADWENRARHAIAWGAISMVLMVALIAMLRRQLSSLLLAHGTLEDSNKELIRSERRYHDLVDGIDGIVWEAEYPSLRFRFVSKNAGKISGYRADEWLGDPAFWEERLHTDPRAVLERIGVPRRPAASDPLLLEHCVTAPDGREIVLMNNMTVSEGEGAVTVRGVMVDTTERKRAYEELELAAKVFESSLLGIFIIGPQETIIRANQAFSDLIGYPIDEVVGVEASSFTTDFNVPELKKAIRASLKTTGKWQGEACVQRKNGDELILMNSMSLVRHKDGKQNATIVICKDITAQRAFERQLHQMAHFDSLTRLPNRRTMLDRLQHAMNLALRQRTRLALMFLDLDHFKQINDSLGHAVGDHVLRIVSDRIRNCMRDADTVARVGGDEFVVLLEGIDDVDTVQRIAQKLCSSVSEPMEANGLELFVGLSIGIALFPNDGTESEALIRSADTAMYRAKLSGRNCWCFFDDAMARSAVRRLEVRMALRHAAERDELMLYYQPQRSLHTGNIIGVEALIRWRRPGIGTVPPQEFIPISEESNLIIPIGNWTIQKACEQAASWLHDKGLHLRVGVNVAARQIRQEAFVDNVRAALDRSGLPPSLLELELTESSVLEDIDDTVEKLWKLKALGITVAIDDFGTGYSSLSYLARLPVDRLKIDQSFVRDTPGDPHYCAIVRTIIAMSDNLGLSVIAEGVESDEQSLFLKNEGCDEIQGYLLSPPRPAEALVEALCP